MMRFRELTKLFGVLTLLHLSTLYVGEPEWLQWVSKVSLLFALLVWFYDHSKWRAWSKWFGLGQLMCLAGDIILEMEDAFVFGLAAFLIGQLFYAFSFVRIAREQGAFQAGRVFKAVALPLLILVFVVVPRSSSAGEMMLPVVAYATVLLTVFTLSLVLVQTDASRLWPLPIGVFVFILSDAILAWGLFMGDPIPYHEIAVMSSYALAQFLLTLGAMRALNAQAVQQA